MRMVQIARRQIIGGNGLLRAATDKTSSHRRR